MPIMRRSGLKAPITTQTKPANAPRRARVITTRPRMNAKRLVPIVESGTRRQTANAGPPVRIKTANWEKIKRFQIDREKFVG